MIEADLQRLKKDGAIAGYEILEQDAEGNILDMRIQPFPPVNREGLSARLARAYQTVLGRVGRYGNV